MNNLMLRVHLMHEENLEGLSQRKQLRTGYKTNGTYIYILTCVSHLFHTLVGKHLTDLMPDECGPFRFVDELSRLQQKKFKGL